MGSKTKQTREEQKIHWETKLKQRLSVLAEKGMESEKVAKDPGVRKIRAKIRQTQGRLKAIADSEKKANELSRIKAEKTAAPKKEKGKKTKEQENEPDRSKRQQKRMKKREGKDKE
jgi:hypothetical protein